MKIYGVKLNFPCTHKKATKKCRNTLRTTKANNVTQLMHIVQAAFLTCREIKKTIKQHQSDDDLDDDFYTLLGSNSVVMITGSAMTPSEARKITSDKLITGIQAK